jgi:prepilin-type N-terminal cleavage/methylation domain-containing protein
MNKKGFTLLEVMVVVVIVGILAAIAIPLYTGYMTRTRRAEAVTALETVALYEEKYFVENNQQYGSVNNVGPVNQLAAVGLTDPNADLNRNYDIVATPGPAGVNNTFVATATPRNQQAGDAAKFGGVTELIIFAIDNNGVHGRVDNLGGFVTNENLWKTLRP